MQIVSGFSFISGGKGVILLGCICFIYYFVMVFSSRRWNTTFSGFWIFLGIMFLVLGRGWAYLPEYIRAVIGCIGILTAAAIAIVEGKIIKAMVQQEPDSLDCMIVLGAQVRGKKVTDALRRRLDRALDYYRTHPTNRIIVSGGQGTGEEVSEAEAMAEYLKKRGVPERDIFLEDASVSTYENLVNSKKIIGEMRGQKIGIVTNNFHIYRAMKLAENVGYGKVYGLAASTKPIVLPNYMMREFFAEGKRVLFKFVR